jgi:hypothetical protein
VKKWLEKQNPDSTTVIRNYVNLVDEAFAAVPAGADKGAAKGAGLSSFDESFRQLREELQRKPDHPVHKLLRAFYLEELQKNP